MIRLAPSSARRTGAATLAAALLATGLAGCGDDAGTDGADGAGGTATEPAEAPGQPLATAAADWLVEEELADGLVVNDEFAAPDYGATVDAIYSLRAIGYDEAAITTMTEAVTADAEAYVTPDGAVYAGNAGKLVTLVTDTGGDPADVGGLDALATLEERTAEDGRTSDDSEYGDYANALGQAWAAKGLSNAGSAEADAATDFLLMQQCEAGFLRQDFSAPDAEDQTCDGSEGQPSVDATALFVLLMHDVEDETVTAAVESAVGYLVSEQAEDGSFAGGGQIPANSNSTGFAGRALQLAGEDGAAEAAATWVREHQLADCDGAVAEESGAIAYDDAAVSAAADKGLTDKTSYQWRLATAQALPALLAAPEDADAAECPSA
ncbi:hypothetical protein KUV85_01900 [Nocardioides panacisoli]|uniref:hypothetical protein n=1 Tax=Nocardioides panacisoli TaxID=627624 RepID=UPI001C63863B|nr:hypothetical protein [Nocardioides panacisoli]QYJ04455.1 hypothetical protein KUV85_01900 [Nocardioides panacisoli]